MTEQMTPDFALAAMHSAASLAEDRGSPINAQNMRLAIAAVAALIAERDAAMDLCRKLAALRDGLDNSNSSAEEMASRLAHKAQAIVASAEGGGHG